MIDQFTLLRSVKALREEKAQRAVDAARKALAEAQERHATLRREVEESAATLPARERALFTPILGREIRAEAVDEVKARVLELLERHDRLADRRDRAAEHVTRCEARLDTTREALRKRQGESEKIDQLLLDFRQDAEARAMAREEAEVEDIFALPRGAGGLH